MVDPDFPWDTINLNFEKIWNEKASAANGEDFQVEATFFFMLLAAIKGHPLANGYVDFLNATCNDLAKQLTTEQKKMLGKILKKLIKTPTLQFLNFVGELAALKHFLLSNDYDLRKVESPIGNGNSIDFRIHDRKDERMLLFEVININLNDDKVESNPDAIEKFMSGRLLNKFEAKEKELAGQIDFQLVPVLWGDVRSINIYKHHFIAKQIDIPKTHEPLAYILHSDDSGRYIHQFDSVSKLVIYDEPVKI